MEPFDSEDYRRRCIASGCPEDITDEMVEEAQAKADAAAFLARVVAAGRERGDG